MVPLPVENGGYSFLRVIAKRFTKGFDEVKLAAGKRDHSSEELFTTELQLKCLVSSKTKYNYTNLQHTRRTTVMTAFLCKFEYKTFSNTKLTVQKVHFTGPPLASGGGQKVPSSSSTQTRHESHARTQTV